MKLLNLLLISIAFITTTSFATSQSTSYENVIVFGDSLTDIGNQGHAPITNAGHDNKRLVWLNDVVNTLWPHAKLYASKHLPKDSNIRDLNVDYAYAGALTGNDTKTPSLIDQENTYLKEVKNQPSPNSLFLIWGGGNDLGRFLEKIPHSQNDIPSMFQAVNNLSKIVVKLEEYGVPASHIYVFNLPNLSSTPEAHKQTKNNPQLLTILGMLSAAYNNELSRAMQQHLAKSHVIDIATLMKTIDADPSVYDFTDLHSSCKQHKKIPDCNGFVFYDNVHPSQKAHGLIALTTLKIIK